ncbi:Pumilio homolog 3, partial [Zea mays]
SRRGSIAAGAGHGHFDADDDAAALVPPPYRLFPEPEETAARDIQLRQFFSVDRRQPPQLEVERSYLLGKNDKLRPSSFGEGVTEGKIIICRT